jgi:hypothetical protein
MISPISPSSFFVGMTIETPHSRRELGQEAARRVEDWAFPGLEMSLSGVLDVWLLGSGSRRKGERPVESDDRGHSIAESVACRGDQCMGR